MTMTNTFREHPQRGNFDGLFQTKIMGVNQILQFRPNLTILEYLEYLEYLELGQFRNFYDVFKTHEAIVFFVYLLKTRG